MNRQVIKIAHVVALGLMLVVAALAVAQRQYASTAAQGSNTNTNAGQGGNTNTASNMNANTGRGQNSNAGGQGRATGAAGLSAGDRKFATTAAMSGMAEVELGRMATERGASDAVRQFGQRMVDDHTRANAELMQAASAAGLTLPTTTDEKHRAQAAKMSQLSGMAFDRAYARQMVKDHEKAVSLFRHESERGADAGLKSFAASTLPALQEHLTMARGLNTQAGGGTTGGNANRGGGGNTNSNSGGNANNSNRR